MVALNNGVIQNKDGRSFDRSTGTWEEPNAENPNQNAEQKPSDAKTSNQNAEQKPSDAKTPKTPAENPNQNAKPPKPPAENPNQNAEKKQTDAKPPKPRVIQYNIDGKKVYISSNDWQHFQELRAQLASGTTLNDDLIEKMKSILAEAHW